MSSKTTKYTAMALFIAVILSIAFILVPGKADAADAAFIFDTNTFTHSDNLNAYDSMTKNASVTPPAGSITAAVQLGVQYSTNPQRIGAYVRGSGDKHYYAGESINYSRQVPSNVLSVYADTNVNFVIRDSNNNTFLADQDSDIYGYNNSRIAKFKPSIYSNMVFYYIEITPFAYNNPNRNFYVEFSTVSNANLHYSVWFGAPVLGRAFTSYIFSNMVTKPSTTSAYDSVQINSFLPPYAWVRSLTLTRSSETNGSALSSFNGVDVIYPGKSTATRMVLGETLYLSYSDSSATNVMGTYQNRCVVTWHPDAAVSQYSFMGRMFVEYYYPFGNNSGMPSGATGYPTQINYTDETMTLGGTGAASQISYFISGVNTGSWGTLNKNPDGTWPITNLIGSAELRVIFSLSSNSLPLSVVYFRARPPAPNSPTFIYNDIANPGMAVLTGLTSAMEYRLSSSSVWTPSNGSNVVLNIPASNQTYQVRYSYANDIASVAKSLTLLAKGAAPNVTVNTTTETIGAITSDMELSTDGVNYALIGTTGDYDISGIINTVSGSPSTIYVRKIASSSAPITLSKSLTIYPRLAQPANLSYNAVTFVISGTANTMQYRVQPNTAWTNITSTTLSTASLVSSAGNTIIEIRYKPTSANSASLPVILTLPPMPPAPSGLSVDYNNELMTGCVPNKAYQHSINGTSWTNITASATGTFSISSIITTSARTLQIREAATSVAPYSDAAQFSIPARPSAPSGLAFVYNNSSYPDNAVLTGLNNTLEYKLSSDTTWTAYNGSNPVFSIPASNATYNVRVKATVSTPFSNNLSISLLTRGSAPSTSINTTTELLASITVNHEVSISGGAYIPVTSTMVTDYTSGTAISTMIDGISGGNTMTLSVRTLATQSAPASNAKVITLYARPAAPSVSGMVYTSSNNRITGTNTTLMWRVPGGSWTNCTTTYITPPSGWTQIEFALKPTATAARSWVAVFQ